jgi:hypothetical protein
MGLDGMSGHIHTPTTSILGKGSAYLLDGSQSWCAQVVRQMDPWLDEQEQNVGHHVHSQSLFWVIQSHVMIKCLMKAIWTATYGTHCHSASASTIILEKYSQSSCLTFVSIDSLLECSNANCFFSSLTLFTRICKTTFLIWLASKVVTYTK